MEDILIGFEDPAILFSKRNNFIYLGMVLMLLALIIYLFINESPSDEILGIMKLSRLRYVISSIIAIVMVQVIALLLALLFSLLPIKKMQYRHKLLRVFLITAAVLNGVVLALMFIH